MGKSQHRHGKTDEYCEDLQGELFEQAWHSAVSVTADVLQQQ